MISSNQSPVLWGLRYSTSGKVVIAEYHRGVVDDVIVIGQWSAALLKRWPEDFFVGFYFSRLDGKAGK